jgi:hypothetical protein
VSLGEWLGIIGLTVGVLGLAVTIGGFWLALLQLRRTADAAEATAAAVQRTEHRMALNHLLVIVPQIRVLEFDLDRAIEENDRLAALRALTSYAHVASEVAGLLSDQGILDSEVLEKLRVSAAAATDAKARLQDSSNILPKTATKNFRREFAAALTSINSVVGRFKLKTQEAEVG